MPKHDRLMELGARLNRIRDRLYLDIYQIINELQRISAEEKIMGKPTKEFREWAASVGIREGSHDWSIAWAAWCAAIEAAKVLAGGKAKK